MLILWGAYQLANWVAPYALNNISPCGKTMSRRQHLLAFWATFLVHNLGGPDNMSGFSLEDNALYWREALLALSRVVGASYVLYKHSYPGSGAGALIPASIIVLVVGAAKYAERVCALRQGHLGNIRPSSKNKPSELFTACASPGLDSGSLITKGMDDQLDDEEALMVAHVMLPFCKRAMADSSVNAESTDNDYELDTSRKIFSLSWENMCKVVEMELSLMYDILYTKAAVIHGSYGVGYIIRFASPFAIGAATVLFGFYYNKEGQTTADVIITYILLLATLLLDTRWLLRALGSTWTHAFLQVSRPCRWLGHAVLCSGKWLQLRHFVVSLDLWRQLLRLTGCPRSPSNYRRWSGTVGQYGLLQECTRKIGRWGKVAQVVGLEEFWKKYQRSKGHKLSQDVKQLVFERVTEVLKSSYENEKDDGYSITMKDIMMSWGQETVNRYKTLWADVIAKKYKKKITTNDQEEKFLLAFGREFQEDILAWHIATKIFIIRGEKQGTLADAISALSEHLMFLMAMHPDMLPGLALHNLYEATLKSLREVVDEEDISSSGKTGEEKLARILVNKENNDSEWGFAKKRKLLVDAAVIAVELLKADDLKMPELLELVFNIWVDKLLYAGTRCSRESHARQLGHGGDLTTIIWIMAEHAGPFRIGEERPYDDGDKSPGDKRPQEEKKKEDVKLKPKDAPEAEWWGLYPPPLYPTPGDEHVSNVLSWIDQPMPDRPPAATPTPSKPPKARRRRYATLYPV
ncbi:uncharacterized protein LOC123429073 isoform X2 [Hordeum vulgare subsp. vulgare]|nr:uncharacterized protein LOC123429073 isoform X2 [Hordeum vulgare subsp. vulgare]